MEMMEITMKEKQKMTHKEMMIIKGDKEEKIK
jgi:hypothetical protein